MWAVLKRDLGEFVTTLKDDATGTIKAAMTLGDQQDSYDSELEETESDVLHPSRHGKEVVSAALRSLRADTNTYTKDITDAERDSYTNFMRTFDLGARTKEIAALFEDDPVLTGIHTDLVPDRVTYDDFWCRYFFRTERVQKGRAAGISFPREDEEEDEDFGWDEDEQDDADAEGGNGQGSADDTNRVPLAQDDTATLAEEAAESSSGRAPGAMAKEAAVEIARLKETLRRTEEERDAALEAVEKAGGRAPSTDAQLVKDGTDSEAGEEVERLTRERDAAVAQAQALASRLHETESEKDNTRASVEDELRRMLEASEARAAAAEERALQENLSSGEAGQKTSAADARAGAGTAAASEIARLKATLREEHAQHEKAMLESRKAANEAVEEALSSADADREEACAEVEAGMAAEIKKLENEVEALRAQLEKQAEVADAESSALRGEVEELRTAVEAKEQELSEATREARQQAELLTQLREEKRVQPATAEVSRALTSGSGSATGRSGVSGTLGRGAHARSENGGGDDTDGWGDEDDSFTAVSTNSSAVVVDHSPRGDDEHGNDAHAGPAVASTDMDAHGASRAGGVDEEVRQGLGSGSGSSPTVSKGTGDEGQRDGEGDDGWDGWD